MFKSKINIVELESEGFHALVRGTVQGHPVRIVLDTGASRSCMDAAFAKSILPDLNSEQHDGVTAGIGGDDFEVRVAHIPNFRLGRFKLNLYENMALIDLGHINQAYQALHKEPIQIILGNDFFVQHKAVLDYKTKFLFFEK